LLDITNGLLGLGKVFGQDELVRKLLGCLNDEWEPKVTAIEESKDLKTMEIEELLGSLMTHEVKLNKKSVKLVETKTQEERRKDIALKSTHKEDMSSEDELEEEDYVLFAKRFTKFAKMNKARRFQRKNFNKGEGSKMDPPTCFECNKPGHIKVDCPQLKKKKLFKKKALKAHLSDDQSSEDEVTEQVANLCFMALSDDEEDSENEVGDSYTFGELQFAFDELLVEFKKKCSQCTSLKKNMTSIEKEKKLLVVENEHLKSDIAMLEHELEKKNVNLEKSFSKFTLGSKKLEEMLGSQRSYLDKTGIGYAPLEVKAKLKKARKRPH
ncbi:LOW QUALITY PROTEIN: zf-CCHC domain-containing protein/UBN2 domain-containing protein, partial [Cephalotus follicularis]